MADYDTATLERAEDIGTDAPALVRRWLLEIKLADKREKDWRDQSKKIWDKYRQKNPKQHSFNILWANTETLRPAVYNSLPKPDVRRRYKDGDPMGKACSEVLGRALEYGLDTTDFDYAIKSVVLDMLLPGRGIARVRYVPSFAQVGVTEETHEEENETHEPAGEALEGDGEELEWEQATIEHVQWDDYRQGAGKEWCEVPWVAFNHRLTRKELEEQFGEIGSLVKLDATEDKDLQQEKDAVADSFKTASVWEIWDKDNQQVLFVTEGYRESPLMVVDDPLNLQGFFPIPRPLYAIEDSSSAVPVPLYELYKQQAEELDRISGRINRLINGLKLRGIYDSTLTELSELMRGEDNDLIPAANVTALLERGGIEKAVLWLPIEQAARVLKELYIQREQCKAVIYEITGISDILRGSTNASETATAQQIKSQWGSNRLKRMQAEVQRFIRDLIRMLGEIVAEKFQVETLATMTGLKFPTAEEKMQAVQAQQQGQQVPELPPSWDEIMAVLRDDKQRTFKIDIETDSTIAASVESDMDGLQKLLGGLAQIISGFGPAVQQGAMPIEAVKEIMLSVTRRAKMGNAVEDALEKMQQPAPQPNGEASKAEADQAKLQQEAQLGQLRLEMEERTRTQELQAEMNFRAMQEQINAEREERAAEREAMLRHQELMQEQAFAKFKALLEAQTKVQVAEIGAQSSIDTAQIDAANKAIEDDSNASV